MSVSLLKMQVSVHELASYCNHLKFALTRPMIHESSGSKVAYSQTIAFLGSILPNLLSSIFGLHRRHLPSCLPLRQETISHFHIDFQSTEASSYTSLIERIPSFPLFILYHLSESSYLTLPRIKLLSINTV